MLPRVARVREGRDARRVAQLDEVRAHGIAHVDRFEPRDHVAVQAAFAIELRQREPGERHDRERRGGEPHAEYAARGRPAELFVQCRASRNASRAAVNVASSSASPWAAETKPASYADGAR